MVKNKLGGNKSKNISSRFANKKIETIDPDFENSFFAIVVSKPNGFMCNLKICLTDKVQQVLTKYNIPVEVYANIGKLKNDKRNSTLSPGDYVAVEFNFDMKRSNGDMYGYILCKYDKSDIKYYIKQGLIDETSNDEEDIISNENSSEDNLDEEEINIDDL